LITEQQGIFKSFIIKVYLLWKGGIKMKKLLTILVVLALVIATFIPAFNGASAEGTSYGNADVDVLIERGIIQGFPDGALHLERALTRAEFAKMLVKARVASFNFLYEILSGCLI